MKKTRKATQKVKLTKSYVESIPVPDSSTTVVRDLKMPGLSINVSKAGTRSWVMTAKPHGAAAPYRDTLGRFPALGVDLARKRAVKSLAKIQAGVNPTLERRVSRVESAEQDALAMSLRDVLSEYVKLSTGLRDSTATAYNYVLQAVCPDWLDAPLLDISALMIRERHASYPSKSQANHAMRALRALFNHFIDTRELDKSNPVSKIMGRGKNSRWHKIKRKRTWVEPSQFKAWFDAVESLPQAGDRATWHGETARDLFLFQTFTGLRSEEECAKLTWAEVDLENATLTLTQTKTTDIEDDAVIVPLNSVALALLKARAEAATGDWVFPGRSRHLSVIRAYQAHVRNVSGLDWWAPGDARRTFKSFADLCDVSKLVNDRLTNHASGESNVSAGYIQRHLPKMREASEKVCQRMLAAKSGNVVEIGEFQASA